MNYEEKYKEALEEAKKLYGKYCINNVLEDLFPELKESKDERIRKEIIDFVKSRGGFKGDWIAWLEKQGETFNADITNRSDEILHAISTGLTDVGIELGWSDFGGIPIEEIQDWLEKQGEKKHFF